MFAAIAAPPTENFGFPTSSHCRANFIRTAISIDSAAYRALPMPVRQAARVSTPESETADTETSLKRETSVAVSSAPRLGYKTAAIGFAKKNIPRAQGIDKINVKKSA